STEKITTLEVNSTQASPYSESCSLSCVVDGHERHHGEMWTPTHAPCSQCLCNAGLITCDKFICDCSSPHLDIQCCPHCDSRAACKHQELPHVSFRSGQRWIYQCQTCECLFGEVDCWPLECPTPHCHFPVRAPGDCCARCPEMDP
ncbi:VWFC domain, partial [Trinorchestia longiramus]